MNTYAQFEATPENLKVLILAVSKLKNRLQERYKQVYPELSDIVRYVVEFEERNAWNLSPLFPHLVLPALVEAHLAQLGLETIFFEPDKKAASLALPEPRRSPEPAVEQVYASLMPEAVPTC